MSGKLPNLPDDILKELIKGTNVKFCQTCKKLDQLRPETGIVEVRSASKGMTLEQISRLQTRVNYNKVALYLTEVETNNDYSLLPELTRKFPNLVAFRLQDAQLSNTVRMFSRAISQSLQHCPYITTLDLSDCHATDFGMRGIFQTLQTLDFLKHINVQNNNLNLINAGDIANTLPHIKSLEKLLIGQNKISRTGGHNLGSVLHACTSLQVLSFKNDSRDLKIQGLAPGLAQCTSLRELDLEGIEMGIQGMYFFAPSLSLCSWLTVLNIGFNNLFDEGASVLAPALSGLSSLTTLELEGNEIADEGCESLAKGIIDCATLQVLNLNANEFGDVAVQHLCQALQHCTNLTVLSLEWNLIRDDGARSLAAILPVQSSLKELDLGQNEITDIGATALAQALGLPLSLSKLHLDQNNFSDVEHIASVLGDANVNPGLRVTTALLDDSMEIS